MKTNLGRVLFFLVFAVVGILNAEDFTYKISVDTKEPYVKEAVVISIDFEQTNPDIVLMLDFDLAKSDWYTFKRVDAQESDTYHNAKAHYTYLLHPLKAGKIDVALTLVKRVTTDESVAYSFSGDRDNVKGLVTTNTKIQLQALQLEVMQVPSETILVGDFHLDYTIKTKKALAYEPIAMQVSIKGEGYPPVMESFPLADENIKIFWEKPTTFSSIVNNVTKSTTIYPLAFSHDTSFVLKKTSIKAFNPKTKQSYFLTLPEQKFDVQEVEESELVDRADIPQKQQTFMDEIGDFVRALFIYVVVFASGFVGGYFYKEKKKKIDAKKDQIKLKIQNSQNERELLQVLLVSKKAQYEATINEIENSLYTKKKLSFRDIKKKVLAID